MHASPGDEIVVDAMQLGQPPRVGEILEVRHDGTAEHYVVRWDDGHETLFYPGAEAHLVKPGHHDVPKR